MTQIDKFNNGNTYNDWQSKVLSSNVFLGNFLHLIFHVINYFHLCQSINLLSCFYRKMHLFLSPNYFSPRNNYFTPRKSLVKDLKLL